MTTACALTRRILRTLVWAPIAAAATVFVSPPVAAQAVTGVVQEVQTGQRIPRAEVLLRTLDLRVVARGQTDEHGLFILPAPRAGTYSLVARRLGYRAATAELVLQTDRLVEVRVSLSPVAAVLDPVMVIGETAATPGQREFLSRRHLPWNYSFDRGEIAQMRVGTIGEVLQLGAPLASMRCMRVYFDGLPSKSVSDPHFGVAYGYGDIPLDWVYGIEVYLQYTDIPLKYRDPVRDPAGRCGAILVWSIFSTEPQPAFYGVALGASAGLERTMLELAWRPSWSGRYVSAIRARVGEYDPLLLFGADEAGNVGYSGAKRLFGSVYLGKQGPAPFLPWRETVYARLAIGASVYGGESDTGVGLNFGAGPEAAVGAYLTNWTVRPWVELRTGVEYITQAGFTWIRPALMLGIEFGGR
ncbi:MAG: hypothetical protein GTN62_05760 [Gemmatimonadales bacterium]|nr:hypothetical protein [Gemmatimonadales bacterium]NIN11005.1 hypothetical protein [Gemmatimonadales bacterium]NIN49602.1 hypothetical protein [Gemmatimonadales bacterium]NIP07066.1 hypothetical protein [Gemmatimonadales bacterium]NIQ99457.1 hypothetical protein [Gemmatimonadales bacterium]